MPPIVVVERLDSLVYALIDHREPFIDARGFTLLNPKSRKFDFIPPTGSALPED